MKNVSGLAKKLWLLGRGSVEAGLMAAFLELFLVLPGIFPTVVILPSLLLVIRPFVWEALDKIDPIKKRLEEV